MNLLSLKRELEQLKAHARANRGSGCFCEYVEVVESEEQTIGQSRLLSNNQQCYERNRETCAHVGFSSIVVPSEYRQ